MKVRDLNEMPFDHKFYLENGNAEFCHATGREVCFDGDDPEDPASWWCEYADSMGGLHYGR